MVVMLLSCIINTGRYVSNPVLCSRWYQVFVLKGLIEPTYWEHRWMEKEGSSGIK